MSPEQAVGRETDCRSDVWSLGATLFELLSGKPPYAGEPDAMLRQIVAQEPPVLTDPALPPALVAIVRRAMQPEPSARYPSAQEMAEDVERWLTGERVQAHRYSSAELLMRFVVARRAAVVVAVVAAVALLLGAVWLVQERNRAVEAELVAEAARDASDANLAQTLTAQALAAQVSGAQPEAEVLAAAALRLAPDDPRARGILSAFSAAGSPQLEAVASLPECDSEDVSPDGQTHACRKGEELTLYERDGDAFVPRWSRQIQQSIVRFTHPERLVAFNVSESVARLDVSDGALLDWVSGAGNAGRPVMSGPDEILWWNGGNGIVLAASARTEQMHWSRRNAAMARLPGGPIILVDVAGGIYAFHSEENIRFIGQTALIGEHQAVYLWPDGEYLVLAGLRGQAVVVEVATGQPLIQIRGQGGNVIDARLSPDRNLFAIAGERGIIEIFRVDTGARIARLPGAGVRAMRFAGDSLTLETFGTDLRRWHLPESSQPRRWSADGGITTVSVSPDGRRLGASTGPGTLWLWDAATGAVLHSIETGPFVIKAADFFGDSETFIYTQQAGGARFVSASSGALLGVRMSDIGLRRLCWAADLLVGSSYQFGPNIFDLRTEQYRDELLQLGTAMLDVHCAADGGAVVLSASDGGVWLLNTARPLSLHRVASVNATGQIAVDSGPARRIALATAKTVHLIDADSGQVRAMLPPPGQRIFDLAFSPDGSLLAGGLLDGSIMIWDPAAGVVLARLEHHTQRVSSLAFLPDGSGLLSASWDGDVRLWSTEPLTAPADELAARIDERWGLSLEDALRRAPSSP